MIRKNGKGDMERDIMRGQEETIDIESRPHAYRMRIRRATFFRKYS
jgi:hypothetical protein